ncbi:MAG: 2,3-bisphosphoglycerate-independent phosphoglycerate mutase [Bacillota bacterium]|nr:2,3-bisphosphoglycerate-independent phosphoglycerate mutase [Bacillota bacterium]
MAKQPVVLMILDGWGLRHPCDDNAVTCANPVNFKSLQGTYPSTVLKCCGKCVGLPDGQMGNSEVGHLNMGAGRIVYQEITRLGNAIENRSFFDNKEFIRAMQQAVKNDGAVHLVGLLSDGGVHSLMTHLYALLEMCKEQQVKRVYVHGFLDGRDVAPKSAQQYIDALEMKMQELGIGQIATLGGRYYGMDRDNRWDRIEKAYDAMVLGEGVPSPNAQAAIERSYEERVTDEFVEPVVLVDDKGNPRGTINDGDSVIFFNFRADRARQISHALVDKECKGFKRRKVPDICYVCMTEYDIQLEVPVAYKPQNLKNTLGEVLAEKDVKQLRIAETEKYAHVTFFFNGGVEEPNPGEERILIPSPDVATYNLKPEMSARELTARMLEELDKDTYDVCIMNYANPDMVGHTGVLEAAIEAVHTVDECLIQVVDKVLEKQGTVLITADHGNCEEMVSPETGFPFTAHTTNLVPFVLVSEKYKEKTLREEGSLRDVAPTLLSIMNIPLPPEMTGRSLVE